MKKFLFFVLLILMAGGMFRVVQFSSADAKTQEGPPSDKVVEALDKNHDQRLTASELESASEVLRGLDANGDGKLTPDELLSPDGGRGGGPRQRGGPPDSAGPTIDLFEMFDADKNGRLENEELELAFKEVRENAPERRRRGPRGGGVTGKPGRKISPADVENYPDKQLYDDSIMRTVFIDVDRNSWEQDMGSLKDYGVDLAADVTVDGTKYPNVGVRFRGNSSYFTVDEGSKRSLNLTFDWDDKKQNLYGYRTLNLLNSHADASFLRLVLYSRIAGNYIPVPKANYVHVVINGESWGVYVNEQQFNKDFTKDFFGTKGGNRWKSPPGRGGTSFAYRGEDKSAYAGYELKSKDTDEAWQALIDATQAIAESDPNELESNVDEILSIDRVLWFLAVDNVLIDMDGYFQRGADYVIFQEPKFNRFHILPYDNNETFRAQGAHGPGFGGGPGGPGGRRGGAPGGFGGPGRSSGAPTSGPPEFGPPEDGGEDKPPFDLDIFAGSDQPLAPFINKFLQNPAIKARYVAHVRTIHEQWVNWNTVSPIIEKYRKLIGEEVRKDTRKLSTSEAFDDGIGMSEIQDRDRQPGLKAFFTARKAFLDQVPELKQPAPKFQTVDAVVGTIVDAKASIKVSAAIDKSGAQPANLFLYYASDRLAKFKRIEMTGQGQNFVATIPANPVGQTVFYYCEARTDDKFLTTSFFPEYAEGIPNSVVVELPSAQ